ncbi:hypothetical protein GCM10027160_46190 [Streptomyces calidiresistens]
MWGDRVGRGRGHVVAGRFGEAGRRGGSEGARGRQRGGGDGCRGCAYPDVRIHFPLGEDIRSPARDRSGNGA